MWNLNIPILILISMSFCVSGNETDDQNLRSRANEFKCISCNTTANGDDCIDAPLQTAHCNSSVDQCYIFMIDDFIQRGCVGDDLISDNTSCNDRPDNCVICSNELCNNKALPEEKCISREYLKDQSELPTGSYSSECPLSIKQMGCYHHEDTIHGKVRKGCVSELSNNEKFNCRKNGENCKICFGHNCNFRIDFQKCIMCDSKNDPACYLPDQKVDWKQCNDYSDKCYTFVENNFVERGCLKDASTEINEKCKRDNGKCGVCFNDDFCNNKPLKDTCIVCDSITEPSCDGAPDSIAESICSVNDRFDSEGCYLQKSDNIIRRGCIQDLTNEIKTECRSQSNDCQICLSRNCNKKKEFQQNCFTCNGLTDPLCSQGYSNETITCPDYSSSCLTGIDARGKTYRGCSSMLAYDERTYRQGFEVCYGEYCNNEIYPATRRLCYQCSGGSDCDFVDAVPQFDATPCDNYANEDECFAYFDNDRRVHRGCMSDKTDIKDFCHGDDVKCKKCSTNACNHFAHSAHSSTSGITTNFMIFIVPTIIFAMKR